MKTSIVIGAGIGGMATGVRLAALGYKVKIFEKNLYPGGKITDFNLNGYRFDAGPSLFTMPNLVEDLFVLCGETPNDFFKYKKKEIGCNYFWEDGTFVRAYTDRKKYLEEIELKLGVPSSVVLKYLNRAQRKYNLTESIFLKSSLHKLKTYANLKTVKALLCFFKLEINTSLHQVNLEQLREKHLVQMYDRYATYNGSSPFKTPGIMTIVQHLESHYGTFIPKKGMNDISKSIYQLAIRQGVEFYFDQKVDKIITENKKIKGVNANSLFYPASLVVSNSDIYFTYKKLLKEHKSPKQILSQEKSSSAIIFYWGISGIFNQLELHNILFSDDYVSEFDSIFNKKNIASDNTIYINITSKDIPEDAPKKSENWFVMINTPSDSGQNWGEIKNTLRSQVVNKINRILKCNIEDYIVEEYIMTPPIIENKTQSHQGALYGSSSNDKMSSFLRHPNFSKKIKNLYFCGGSVHPGGGIPLCLLSAKIVEGLVSSKIK